MFGPHTVEIINPGTKAADYGNGTQDDWDAATVTPVHGCSVQPAPSTEFTVDRDSVTTRWTAWLAPGAPVTSRSRIRWNGDTYDVDGDVQRWEFPPVSHLVATLKRSTG